MATKDFNLTITRDELIEIAPALLDAVREFVTYGLCRHANTWERKIMAEKFESLAHETLLQFPQLKLDHVGAKTIITDGGAR
jgi:hypothetical protein